MVVGFAHLWTLAAPAELFIAVNFNLSDAQESCSPRSPPSAASSADTLTKNVHKFEGCRRREKLSKQSL